MIPIIFTQLMRRQSKSKTAVAKREAYKKSFDGDGTLQTCLVCGGGGDKYHMDRHHTRGRRSMEQMLDYVYVHRACHDYLHRNPNESLEKGWLTPEFFGKPKPNNTNENTTR